MGRHQFTVNRPFRPSFRLMKVSNDSTDSEDSNINWLVRFYFFKASRLKALIFRCGWLLTISIVLTPLTCFGESSPITIKASSLANTLVEFVSQTGAVVVLDSNVDTSIHLSAMQTHAETHKALTQMVSGHSLVVEKNEAGHYVIRRAPNPIETVEVGPWLEELIVTGTSFKGGLGHYLYPLTILDRDNIKDSGSPSLIDIVANTPSISGSFNQSNQFLNVNSAGTANINLRGLGVSRTLVLLNGKRMPASSLPHNDGQAFVDINTIPAFAIEQIDILKEGASATYGSDAIAGVVNFITRKDFEGFEWQASGQKIDDSNGDWNIGFLSGLSSDAGHCLAGVNYSKRSELTNASRSNITSPRIDIPELQRIVYSVSSLGNPGSFIPIDTLTAENGLSDAEVATSAMGPDNYVRDPQCTNVGGTLIDGGRCGFNYVAYDNITEEEERWQAFSSWESSLSEEFFGQDSVIYGELNLAITKMDDWKTAPSYAPVQEASTARYIPDNHPGLIDFIADNPEILENDGDIADFSGGAVFVGRPVGVSGEPASGLRNHKTLRLLSGIRGSLEVDYDMSLTYASNRAESLSSDTLIDRWEAALSGFGGPQCRGNIAGQNGCLYYNPFSSAIPSSPNFDPSLSNSAQLLDWIREDLIQTNTSELFVADALFSNSHDYSDKRSIEYSLGLQYRQERLKIRFNDLADVTKNPGDATSPNELPGIFIFFRGGYEDDVTQSVAAIFGEMALSLGDDLLIHFAMRYENYAGNIGPSLDPKIALRWNASPDLVLRASTGTNFRAPSLNQTSFDTTSLELIGSAFAFKAVDRIGNTGLKPEQSINSNIGLTWRPNQHWHFDADYWHFDLSDTIIQESANGIVKNVNSDPNSSYASQIILDGSGNLSRVITNYVNGPDILVDGFDIRVEYRNFLLGGSLTTSIELAYLNRYDVTKSDLLPAFSADGHMNAGTFVRSLPKLRGSAYLNFNKGITNTRLVANAVSAYTDNGLDFLKQTSLESYITEKTVQAFYTLDSHFTINTASENTSFTISIINIADKSPPPIRQDMRFDTTQHNAFGRMIKLSVQQSF